MMRKRLRESRESGTQHTISTLLIVLGSVVAGLVSNDLSGYLPAAIQTNPIAYFLGTLALILIVSVALIAADNFAPQGSLLRHNRRLLAVIVALRVAQALLVAFAGIVSSSAWEDISTVLPDRLQTSWIHILGSWAAIAVVVLVVAFPFVLELRERRSRTVKTNRERFLNQLFIRYDTFLNDPLERAVRAELGLAEIPAALRLSELVITPLDMPEGNQPIFTSTWTLQQDQTLRQFYNQIGGQLLILGEPGSGKSTQLHELARELALHVQETGRGPLPVILDLSTWAANRDPLTRWLVDALAETYDVRKDVAQRWVDDQEIALLLDALDVMAEDALPRCVTAINDYHRAHPDVPLVVCCRREQYARLSEVLEIRQTVMFQPLTDEAIDAALADCGRRVERLRTVVAEDATLRDALRTPLMLSMAVLTYKDLRDEAIPPVTDVDAWRRKLYSRYVRRMSDHQPGSEQLELHYSEETFSETLAWLGYMLRTHDKNTFLLERLQADWLPSTAKRHYNHLMRFLPVNRFALIRPVAGTGWSWSEARSKIGAVLDAWLFTVMAAVTSGWIYAIGIIVVAIVAVRAGLFTTNIVLLALLAVLAILLVIMLITLLIGALIGGMRGQPINERDIQQVNAGIRSSIRLAIAAGLGTGLGIGLSAAGLTWGVGTLIEQSGLNWQGGITALAHVLGSLLAFDGTEGVINTVYQMLLLALGCVVTLAVPLLAGVLMASRELLRISRRAYVIVVAISSALVIIPGAALIAMQVGILNVPQLLSALLSSHIDDMMSGLIYGLNSDGLHWLGSILFVGFFALVGYLLDKDLGLGIGGVAGVLAMVLSGALGAPLFVGLLAALSVGMGVGMRVGGSAAIKHYALRRALQQAHVIPPRLERFLSEADHLVLLRPVGGGYQFVHQSVRDFFSEQYSSAS